MSRDLIEAGGESSQDSHQRNKVPAISGVCIAAAGASVPDSLQPPESHAPESRSPESRSPTGRRKRGYWFTPEGLELLRTLWADGTPTAEIARRLNTSKSSLCAKASRMGLTPRAQPANFVASRRTYPARIEKPGPRQRPEPKAAEPAPVKPASTSASEQPEAQPAQPAPRIAYVPHGASCVWPIEAGRACEAATYGRTPYCETHAARAYAGGSWRTAALTSAWRMSR